MDSNRSSSQANEARAAEAAAIRRRWLTLGEVLAVAALVISALTLWLNWTERSDVQAQQTVQSKRASARAATLTLRAEAAGGGDRLDLRPVQSAQQIQEQTIRFPDQLSVDAVETSGEPRVESDWFEDSLKKARNRAGLPDDSRGDERLPVIVTTHFLVDGQAYEDSALYDIGYTISGRMLGGHSVTLRGISLVKRLKLGETSQALADRAGRLLSPKTN